MLGWEGCSSKGCVDHTELFLSLQTVFSVIWSSVFSNWLPLKLDWETGALTFLNDYTSKGWFSGPGERHSWVVK